MLAFVLLVSRRSHSVNPSTVAKCTRYDTASLPFEPDQYLGWHSKDRRLYLFAWQAFAEQGQAGSHWHIGRDHVVLFSGLPVPLDTPWTPGRSWADQLANRIGASGANTVAAELGGAFTLLHLQAEGDSIVTNDLLGGAPLYWRASQDLLVISNRANMVAWADDQSGDYTLRDWRGPSWPVFFGEPFGSETGLKDVSTLPPGAWWDLGWQKFAKERQRPLPCVETDDPAGRIEATLRQSLRAIAALPFRQCTLALDGARASRLLLGLLHAENLLDRVALETLGETDEPNVQIAAELAALVERPLLVRPRAPFAPDAFTLQAGIQSFQTSGAGTPWEQGGQLASDDSIRIESNLAGMLAPSDRQRALLTGDLTFDRLGVLQPPIAAFFRERIGSIRANTDPDRNSPIALAANPRSVASVVEVPTIAHAYPYLDPAIWSALRQVRTDDLLADAIYRSIMERVAPALLSVPVCEEPGPLDSRVANFDALLPVFEEYLLDPENPIHDVIDTDRVIAFLNDPERTPAAVRVLYDLLAVAIWLDRDEQKFRIHRADEIGVRGIFGPLDAVEPAVLGDAARLPQPDTSRRDPATDQVLDGLQKLDRTGVRLTAGAKILGVIPYFEAEQYLEAAIDSLVKQTRPLDGIVVIDDMSSTLPLETLAKFPNVTLLRSEENSGPYRLIQEVIDSTGYDAFLFQDADDWSNPQRLEVLLDLAKRTGKELIGSQGHRLIVDEGEVVLYEYPLDAAAVIQENPKSKPVHHPTSLVTRDLIQQTGGFCTGLPYSGDTEFLRRAATIGPIANTGEFTYVYRTRSDSLTGSQETGVYTAVRRQLWAIQHPRAQWISDRVRAGLGPILAPMAVTSPATLTHISGPALLGADGQPWPHGAGDIPATPARQRATSRRKRRSAAPPQPVFVIGSPRSGASLLALAMAQVPAFKLILDPPWLTNLSSALHVAFSSSDVENAGDPAVQQIDSEQFAAHFGTSAHELLLHGIDPSISAPFGDDWLRELQTHVPQTSTRVLAEGKTLVEHGFDLYRLFPYAKFIHVLRDPDEVVSAHQEDRELLYRSRFVYMDEERAYDRWIETVQAARDLEIALGAEKVMRVDRAALIADPEATLRAVLSFVGEPYDPVVLRPFA